jgi:RND superfamily putative drug exporter
MLATWAVVLLASFLAIGTLLGSALTTDQQITTNPESKRAADLILEGFPRQDGTDEIVVLHARELTADDQAFQQYVSEVRAALMGTEATRTVSDPFASASGSAISQDGRAVLLAIAMGPDAEDAIVRVLDEVEAADKDPAFDAAVTGEFTINHDFNELASHDLEKGELLIGLPAALIVLLLVFGAVVAALLPMGIAIVSIIVTVALSALVGQAVTLSFFIVNMVTAMGLALGIDYSLFVLSRYREERHNGLQKTDAIIASGATASKAVLFSGSSFVVALFGLLLVPDTILRSLAFGAILVGIVTVIAALTLLPALLALLGDRVNAMRLPFFGREQHGESRFWARAVRGVVRRPASALVASVLLLLVLAAPVLDLRTGNAGVSSLPDNTFSKAGFLALERNFPGSVSTDPAQVVIAGDLRTPEATAALARLQTAIKADAGFGPSTSDLAPAGDVAVVSVPLRGDPNSDQARSAVDRLRADLVPTALAQTELTGYVGGATAENIDYTDLINQWLPLVLAFVLGVSFLLLTVIFRSIVLAGTAVLLNLLSVGAAYGLLVLVFQKGYGTELFGFQQVERVEAWVPVFLFSVLFALSMDYHVFLVTRIRERFLQSGDTVDAVVHGIAATGRIITGAALIIVAVFAGFAAGDLVMFQQMGFGVGVALLLDATLIRMVVVPAAMTVLGRWNWYLPSWLDWLPELHVEGDPTQTGEGAVAAPDVISIPGQKTSAASGMPAEPDPEPHH